MGVGNRILAVPVAALLLMGCSEDGPVAPLQPGKGDGVQLLSCQVDIRSGSLSCAGDGVSLGDGGVGAVLGGQGVYVELTSRNVAYDAGSEVFSAEVSIRNMINQVIGTADGTSPAPEGVRIFFTADPVAVAGSGDVTVRNHDGTADFTAAGQPYFQYSQALAPGRTSLWRTWEWNVPSTVDRFTFEVGVSAPVADEPNIEPGFDFLAHTIAADSLHTCALDYSGQAWCWGWGGSGRLGIDIPDPEIAQPVPAAVDQGGLRFVSIQTGLNFTCALTDTRDAWCWGYNGNGRLGVGTTTNSHVPIQVHGGHKFKEITLGRTHVCGLTEAGKAWCWGNNANGHFGNGTTEHASEPVPAGGDLTFTTIAAGSFHTCGVTTDGETYCWGSSTNGKLGIGPVSGVVPDPVKVEGDHRFASVYADQQHTCALTLEGEAWCWGLGGSGRTGIGSTDTVRVPTKVATTERFASLSLANFHTCGVTIDGRGLCWGSNGRGKIGQGNTTVTNNPEPLPIVDIDHFAVIAAGSDHTCGVTPDGKVYCWGNWTNGRLGPNATASTGNPVLVDMPGPIALLNDAPASCTTAGEGNACFPRRAFNELILLASRGAVIDAPNSMI